jgi:TRAP-type C4-dicarboxylate transport system permease small subunit
VTGLVSADAIVGADATMLVGIIFIVTMRQAMDLPITWKTVSNLAFPMTFFGGSLGMLVLADMIQRWSILSGSSLQEFLSRSKDGSEVLLVLGIFLTFVILQGLFREVMSKNLREIKKELSGLG